MSRNSEERPRRRRRDEVTDEECRRTLEYARNPPPLKGRGFVEKLVGDARRALRKLRDTPLANMDDVMRHWRRVVVFIEGVSEADNPLVIFDAGSGELIGWRIRGGGAVRLFNKLSLIGTRMEDVDDEAFAWLDPQCTRRVARTGEILSVVRARDGSPAISNDGTVRQGAKGSGK